VIGVVKSLLMPFLIFSCFQILFERVRIQANLSRQFRKDLHFSNVFLFLKKGLEDTKVVLIGLPVFPSMLISLEGKMAVGLRRDPGKNHGDTHLFCHRIHGAGPGVLQIVILGSQAEGGAGTQFKGHPLNLHILSCDGLS
jgi:hypothetical protein